MAKSPPTSPQTVATGAAALVLGSLGVVFGDIGTSPLYAIQTIFTANDQSVGVNSASVYGVISLVVWTVILVVSIKYVTFVMRADNDGEGGIMALVTLIRSTRLRGRLTKPTLVALGVVGASLFYGDGMITPAISVLSAVEGIEVAAPSVDHLVVPLTVAVLTALFTLQRYGTAIIGRLFGPIMLVWFSVLAVLGIRQIADHPSILKALSPSYGVEFFLNEGGIAFLALASVVLVVTGAEALYADMGHFGRPPIRRAWFLFVFPALTLNYLGQGALILSSPTAITNPFYLSAPGWARIPLVVLATAATVIASQALISGAFSVTRQAIQLGFLPRMFVRHTSEREIGQIYLPAINWGLFAGVIVIVIGFESASSLASAYGVAVTGTFVFTSVLFLVVARYRWHKPLWMIGLGAAGFLLVDLAFFTANLTKIPEGGWLPLAIAAVIFTVLMTWQRGRVIVTRNRTIEEGSLREFVTEIHHLDPPIHRVAGTAVFMNPSIDTTPLALRANVEHNHTLHEHAVIATVEILQVPIVPKDERLLVDDLGYSDDGISHVTLRFGFMENPDVPGALKGAQLAGGEEGVSDSTTYFVSRIAIVPTAEPTMRKWRKKLFVTISRNTASPVEYFGLPSDRTILMGGAIEV